MIIEPILLEDVDPAEEPVTIEQARGQCEASAYGDSEVDPVDDAKFALWIAAAREHCENFLGLSLAPKMYTAHFWSFPCFSAGWNVFPHTYPYGRRSSPIVGYAPGILLPMGPVRWARIEYGEESDALALDEGIGFTIDRHHTPNRLLPVDSWPALTGGPGAVRVTYAAGYGVNSDASIPTPAAAKMAILGLVAYFYENRGNTTETALLELPKFVEALLRPLRVRLGMA